MDGYVMTNFLLDPRILRDELKISNLNHIDDIISFIKMNKSKNLEVKKNLVDHDLTSSVNTNDGPTVRNLNS